jgi:hypothetical protein
MCCLLLVCGDTSRWGRSIWMDMNNFFGQGRGHGQLGIGSYWCQNMKVIFVGKNCGRQTQNRDTPWRYKRFGFWTWDWSNWRWNCYSVQMFPFCCCKIILWEMLAAYELLVQRSYILHIIVYAQSLWP